MRQLFSFHLSTSVDEKKTRMSRRKLLSMGKFGVDGLLSSLQCIRCFGTERSANQVFDAAILTGRKLRLTYSLGKLSFAPTFHSDQIQDGGLIIARPEYTYRAGHETETNSYLPFHPQSMIGASSSQRCSKNWKSRLPA